MATDIEQALDRCGAAMMVGWAAPMMMMMASHDMSRNVRLKVSLDTVFDCLISLNRSFFTEESSLKNLQQPARRCASTQ